MFTSISKYILRFRIPSYVLTALIASTFIIRQISIEDASTFNYRRYGAVIDQVQNFTVDHSPSVVVFGPSDINLNFSPALIHQISPSNIHFYNFGVIMAGPPPLQDLTAQFAKRLQSQGEKVDISVIRFMPMMHTRTYAAQFRSINPYFRQFVPSFTGDMLLNKNKIREQSFSHYLDLLHGGFQQGLIRRWLFLWLEEHLPALPRKEDSNIESDSQFRNIYSQFWEQLSSQYLSDLWPAKKDGEIDAFSWSDGSNGLKHFVDDHKLEIVYGGLEAHQQLYGAYDQNFDPRLIAKFFKSLKNLKKVSKKVVILYLPEHLPASLDQRSPQAKKRLATLLKRLKKNEKALFLDYTDLDLSEDDFIDITHLTMSGKQKFNQRLGKDLTTLVLKQ